MITKVTIEQPIDRKVTIELSEANARILKAIIGQQSVSSVEDTARVSRETSLEFQRLYNALSRSLA